MLAGERNFLLHESQVVIGVHSIMDRALNKLSHDDYLFRVDDYPPSAWLGHAPFLKFLIREFRPSVFVELGVHNGFSYFLACQSIKECALDTSAYAVDHWQGDSQAGFFDDSVFQGVLKLNSKYREFSTLLKMTFLEALDSFEDSTVDLLHIDGLHTYEAVKQDFESWLCKMSTNGIILLHDIYVRRDSFGVFKFWEEIKTKFKTMEFVGSHGLGVVFLGEIPDGLLHKFYINSLEGGLSSIQGAFGSISDDVIQNSNLRDVLSAIAERDSAIAERDSIQISTIWMLFKPYRRLKKFLLR